MKSALPKENKCPYCNKNYSKKGIGTHIWRIHEKGKSHDPNIGFKNGEREIWNKGLSKELDKRIKKYSKTLSENVLGEKNPFFNKHHSEESKRKIGIKNSLNNKGGRCKWYEVQNPNGQIFKAQGTWEVRFSKVLNLLDENWIKLGIGNKEHSFKWIDDENNKHTYTPDFFSPKLNKYFEVKGYWWGNDKRKMELVLEQNIINVEIIKKKELIQYEKLI